MENYITPANFRRLIIGKWLILLLATYIFEHFFSTTKTIPIIGDKGFSYLSYIAVVFYFVIYANIAVYFFKKHGRIVYTTLMLLSPLMLLDPRPETHGTFYMLVEYIYGVIDGITLLLMWTPPLRHEFEKQ